MLPRDGTDSPNFFLPLSLGLVKKKSAAPFPGLVNPRAMILEMKNCQREKKMVRVALSWRVGSKCGSNFSNVLKQSHKKCTVKCVYVSSSLTFFTVAGIL